MQAHTHTLMCNVKKHPLVVCLSVYFRESTQQQDAPWAPSKQWEELIMFSNASGPEKMCVALMPITMGCRDAARTISLHA